MIFMLLAYLPKPTRILFQYFDFPSSVPNEIELEDLTWTKTHENPDAMAGSLKTPLEAAPLYKLY